MVKRQNNNITKKLLGKDSGYSEPRAIKINASIVFET